MNEPQPILRTHRLLLRPFAIADAARVQHLAGAREICATTLSVPHPYADGLAEQWIASHAVQFYAGMGVTFAITLAESGELVGAIGMRKEGELIEEIYKDGAFRTVGIYGLVKDSPPDTSLERRRDR